MRSSTLARGLHRRVPGIGIAVVADANASDPYGLPIASTTDAVLKALTETVADGDGHGRVRSDERRDQLAMLRSLTPRERTAEASRGGSNEGASRRDPRREREHSPDAHAEPP
jgi:hypothetical protein